MCEVVQERFKIKNDFCWLLGEAWVNSTTIQCLLHYSSFIGIFIFPFFASNGSPIQNLVYTNSYLNKEKPAEFEMHEKKKRVVSANEKLKHYNVF